MQHWPPSQGSLRRSSTSFEVRTLLSKRQLSDSPTSIGSSRTLLSTLSALSWKPLEDQRRYRRSSIRTPIPNGGFFLSHSGNP
mmetsp:Transcript_50781/g.110195  ORF Transcript_50781/g.110195 Transcript_50781/m.110195 type:complete len:83 (-) Transcript_50781:73-321(-)